MGAAARAAGRSAEMTPASQRRAAGFRVQRSRSSPPFVYLRSHHPSPAHQSGPPASSQSGAPRRGRARPGGSGSRRSCRGREGGRPRVAGREQRGERRARASAGPRPRPRRPHRARQRAPQHDVRVREGPVLQAGGGEGGARRAVDGCRRASPGARTAHAQPQGTAAAHQPGPRTPSGCCPCRGCRQTCRPASRGGRRTL